MRRGLLIGCFGVGGLALVAFIVAVIAVTVDSDTPPPRRGLTPVQQSQPTATRARLTPTSQPRPTATRQPATMQVEYLVTSTFSINASLTYTNAQGGIEQVNSYTLPWNKVYEMDAGDFASVSAQNLTDAGVTIRCEIKIDGQVWRQSESSGGYVIASCSGIIGAD